MGKLIGIDLGMKRTGIAVTDELQIIASPLETVQTGELLKFLDTMVKSDNIEGIIIGEPRYLDGSASDMTRNVQLLKAELEKKLPGLPIEQEDDKFTSKMAMDALIQTGAGKKKRTDKSILDKMSASLILQSYLERRNLQKDRL